MNKRRNGKVGELSIPSFLNSIVKIITNNGVKCLHSSILW